MRLPSSVPSQSMEQEDIVLGGGRRGRGGFEKTIEDPRGCVGGHRGSSLTSMGEGADGMTSFLSDIVLSWTVQDIENDDLNRSKVNNISTKFRSVEQFFEIHSKLLVEETRAAIKSAMLDIEKTRIFHIISAKYCNSSVCFVDIDLERARSDSDMCYHVAYDYDIFLMSCQSPLHPEFDKLSCCLGISIKIGPDTSYQRSFKVLMLKDHFKEFQPENIKFATFLTNIMVNMKISKVISFTDEKKSAAIKAILKLDKKAKNVCKRCSELCEIEEFSDTNKYNEEQVQYVTSILSKLRCPHKRSVELVWGPPGTGKTRIASTLVNYLLNQRFRILVCVPTGNSINMFLCELQELFPSFNFNNLLVLNSTDDVFAEASLRNRSHELYCSLYLWKGWIKEMSSLLGLSRYLPKQELAGQPTCSKSAVAKFSFSSFKERFQLLVADVRYCSKALINSISAMCLTEQDVENVNNMLSTLSEFEVGMQNDGISNPDVQRAFGLLATLASPSDGTDCNIADSLNKTRIRCIGLIKGLLGSVKLPELDGGTDDLEKICIRHSKIIVCTPDYSSRLNELEMEPIDILIVDDAAQIRESDMLIPLSIPPRRHVVLLGDHLHVQPTVKSKVCKEAGYAMSLFERLVHLTFDRKILSKQYMMDPMLREFPAKIFYQDRILDGSHVKPDGYDEVLKDIQFSAYTLFDISSVDELSSKEKGYAESSTILVLLEDLCGRTNANARLRVGIVCVYSNRANEIACQLGTKYESHNGIHLEIKSIDNLNDWYDVIILSSVCDDPCELPEDTRLNVVLTRSRHCLWVIGEPDILVSSTGAWKKLYMYMMQKARVVKMCSEAFSEVMQKLEMNNQNGPVSSNPKLQNKSMQEVGQEFTWEGRPLNSKYILAPLRDQKNAPDTCSFQAILGAVESLNKYHNACLDPPQSFSWNLSVDHLKSQYEQSVSVEFGEEDKSKRGKHRLETALDILKHHGVIGSNKAEYEDHIFKISSYSRLDVSDAKQIKTLMRSGSIMVCYFRLSRDYYLKPGQTYMYDEKNPYIHPKSDMIASHAVMVVGDGRLPMPTAEGKSNPRCRNHVAIQNSEGKRFGFDGFGRVLRRSLRGLYQIKISETRMVARAHARAAS